MKVSFDFTIDDLVDSAERAVTRSGVVRGWRWQRLVVSCGLTAVIAYVIVPGSEASKWFGALIAAILCAAILPFSTGGTRKRRLQQYFIRNIIHCSIRCLAFSVGNFYAK